MWNYGKTLLIIGLSTAVNSQGCKPMPKAVDGVGWKMGPPVAMNPKDVPEGCSEFEVIIGEFDR